MARISRYTGSNAARYSRLLERPNQEVAAYHKDALESAASFRHKIKHYLIDAASSDGTREYLAAFATATGNSILLSQTGTGLYPALNQAVTAAVADPEVTHIGFLHSDDRLISTQFDEYLSHIDSSRCDFFYSDIEYHDQHDRCFRVWNAGRFSMFKLKTGWMPPHTSVTVAKHICRYFGVYNPEFGTAAATPPLLLGRSIPSRRQQTR